MATLTASACYAGVQPKAIHAGVNAVYGVYSLSAALSAGDVLTMVKVPNGARIVDGRINFGLNNDNLVTVTVGDGADPNRYVDSTSVSAAITSVRFNIDTMDYSYSAADTIDITISAVTSATATGSVQMTVLYMMDQNL